MAPFDRIDNTNGGKTKAWSLLRVSSVAQVADSRDGFQRQEELLQEWLRSHPEVALQQADMLRLRGVSGFTGKHYRDKSTGLGLFIELSKQGLLASPGDILLVEDISRLTRLAPVEALLGLLSQLVWELKLRVITVNDGQEYSPDVLNRDPAKMHGLLAYAQSAHSESERKSRHMRSVWGRKLKEVPAGTIITAQAPSWLTPIRDDKGKAVALEIDPDKAAVVRKAVDLRLQGLSDRRVVSALADAGHKIGRTTVRRWLIDQPERLAGIHPAHRSQAGPDGKYRRVFDHMVRDAYPAIITEQELDKLKSMTAAGVDRDPVTTHVKASWSLAGLLKDSGGQTIRRHVAGKGHGRDKLVFADGTRIPVEVVEQSLVQARGDLEAVPGGLEEDDGMSLILEEQLERLMEMLDKHPSDALAEKIAGVESELREARQQEAKTTQDASGRLLELSLRERLPGLWHPDPLVRNSAARFCFTKVVLEVDPYGFGVAEDGGSILLATFHWRGGGQTERNIFLDGKLRNGISDGQENLGSTHIQAPGNQHNPGRP
jgi:DNA invertase Pin-like site-specific DNA recombinase